jgi:hypothetical protein
VTARVDDCCGDPSTCARPCGVLGYGAQPIVRSRFFGSTRPAELKIPAVHAPVAETESHGTRYELRMFAWYFLAGCGLAMLLCAIVMFFRVTGGAQ